MNSPSVSNGWPINLDSIQNTLVNVALEAGHMITSASFSPSDTSTPGTKKNSADLVTATDREVEQMISKTLNAKYPTFAFMGEETSQAGQKLTAVPTFIVDPIDGTTNFVHGYPYVSVSMGFAVDREPVIGVVYNPFTGELYTGVKGRGSWKLDYSCAKKDSEPRPQKLPLRPARPLTVLSDALVAVEWGNDRSGSNWDCKVETWKRLGAAKEEGGAMIHSARSLGSAALNLCAVAEGGIDLYWEGGCWAWDVCAGWVVLSEAGGIIVDGNRPANKNEGWHIPVDHRSYLAVRASEGGKGQREVVEEFWSFVVGKMEYEH